MLVFSRRKNESIVIGDDILLTIVEIRGDKIRLGVACPKEMSVHRQEVHEALYGTRQPEPPPRSPEEMAFLQAILEEPDDEGLRLIFADWLEERGDTRGDFIHIQCQLARLRPGDDGREDLEERERVLWAEHADAWRAYLPPVLRWAAFERGFVETAHLSVEEFLDNAEAIFAAAPVRRLRVARPAGQVAALAASPYLGRLAGLDLSELRPGDGEAALLAASPHAATLRSLVLRGGTIGDAGAAALAASPWLAGLATLDLAGNRVGEEGKRALQARFAGRVRL
jgi:carbon storage regulator CsrA